MFIRYKYWWSPLQKRSAELFTMLVKRGGVNIQQLHTIADGWQPLGPKKPGEGG